VSLGLSRGLISAKGTKCKDPAYSMCKVGKGIFVSKYQGDEMGKERPCRICKKKYLTPSIWPGCCSEECRIRRIDFLQKEKKRPVRAKDITDDTRKWLDLRYQAFRKYGRKCYVCGLCDRLEVDHIKPRSKYPHLIWSIDNLQILCHDCNSGKSNKYNDRWK